MIIVYKKNIVELFTLLLINIPIKKSCNIILQLNFKNGPYTIVYYKCIDSDNNYRDFDKRIIGIKKKQRQFV
jgi:hypothetical protein